MTIIRVGSNQKYSEGWDTAFSKGRKSAATAVASVAKSAGKKATAKKSAGKKATAKKSAGKPAKAASAKKKAAGKKKRK